MISVWSLIYYTKHMNTMELTVQNGTVNTTPDVPIQYY